MTQTEYFRFFQDLWRLLREHLHPVSADEWWEQLLRKGTELAERYGAGSFVVKIISTVLWEIERIYQVNNSGSHEGRRRYQGV